MGALLRDLAIAIGCGVAVAATGGIVMAGGGPPGALQGRGPPVWWDAGSGRTLAAFSEYEDPEGKLGVLIDGGAFETAGHPFFTPLGTNGRACITCHQPAYGMSVSTSALQARWLATGGKDPVFAAIDGSNCPSLRQDLRSSHSLLLQKGLFRIYLPWPAKDAEGRPIRPEFKIEVVRDPTGCNIDPVYGLRSPHPTISVFRRPRVAANLKYVVNDFDPDAAVARGQFNVKTGMPLATDPETGRSVTMELMADSRAPTLRLQAVDAALQHEQAAAPPTRAELDRILDLESRVFAAQSRSTQAGDLTVPGGPPGLGPAALQRARPRLLGDYLDAPVFQSFDAWAPPSAGVADAQGAFRASVARGAQIYMTRTFWIRDAVHLNTIGLGNPIRRTCATCHNAQMTGMDLAPGWMDIGTNNAPYADPRPDLPLFKLTCDPDRPPHPFLGRVVFTHDPGRALVTGKCIDIGSITMQQFRGLAARAPYFADGSAKDLRALVDYYDRRFKIRYSEQEKQDLVNFLGVL